MLLQYLSHHLLEKAHNVVFKRFTKKDCLNFKKITNTWEYYILNTMKNNEYFPETKNCIPNNNSIIIYIILFI